ncbi:MAG: hypothetical protein IPL23_27235 [Saprospiraceae bacterium]|nr:hypothetical protein [Saprospiraceae bacterium]
MSFLNNAGNQGRELVRTQKGLFVQIRIKIDTVNVLDHTIWAFFLSGEV